MTGSTAREVYQSKCKENRSHGICTREVRAEADVLYEID